MKLISINKSYGEHKVLQDFSLEIPKSSITCLLGPSGCGKTTILNIIANLIDYDGTVSHDKKGISYIFQNTRLLPNLTVEQNLEYVLASIEKDKDTRMEEIDNILKLVELDKWRGHYPYQLSGGMQQRVSMARAFIYPSTLLLMDEPFKGLDIVLKKKLISAFLDLWQNDNKTVVFVTHDIDEALLLCNKLVLLSPDGRNIWSVNIDTNQHQRDLSQALLLDIRKDIYKRFK